MLLAEGDRSQSALSISHIYTASVSHARFYRKRLRSISMVRPQSHRKNSSDSLNHQPNNANPFLGVDPNQMYILSGKLTFYHGLLFLELIMHLGPFPSNDPKCGVLIACPVPPGSTVIAKPIVGAPSAPPFDLSPESVRPIDPTSFDQPHLQGSNCSSKNPMVMIWNAENPKGKLVPLRQPSPPVYFQPQNVKP